MKQQPDLPKTAVEEELQRLQELGAAGDLWTLEFEYNMDNERKLKRLRNLTTVELMVKRNKMFTVGLTLRIEAGHWRIICPIDIKRVEMYQQSGYFSG